MTSRSAFRPMFTVISQCSTLRLHYSRRLPGRTRILVVLVFPSLHPLPPSHWVSQSTCNLLLTSTLQWQPAAPTIRDLVFINNRTINYAISAFDRFHTQLKLSPAQRIVLLFHLVEDTYFWVGTCTTRWTSRLKNKKSWKHNFHLPVKCTLNFSCSLLVLFSYL